MLLIGVCPPCQLLSAFLVKDLATQFSNTHVTVVRQGEAIWVNIWLNVLVEKSDRDVRQPKPNSLGVGGGMEKPFCRWKIRQSRRRAPPMLALWVKLYDLIRNVGWEGPWDKAQPRTVGICIINKSKLLIRYGSLNLKIWQFVQHLFSRASKLKYSTRKVLKKFAGQSCFKVARFCLAET